MYRTQRHCTQPEKLLQAGRALALLLIGLVLFAGASTAHAQVDATFGVRASGGLTTFQGEDSDALNDFFVGGTPAGVNLESSFRPGFGAGLFIELSFDSFDTIALRPEVGYVQRGDMIEDDSGSTTYSLTTKVDYIETPLLLKVNLPSDYYIVAGPSIGFSIGTPEIELENLEFTDTREDTLELNDDAFESTVYGAVIGFGASIDNVWLDLRYEHGLSEIFTGTADVQNQGVSIAVGFGF